jgi:hypothetical protein
VSPNYRDLRSVCVAYERRRSDGIVALGTLSFFSYQISRGAVISLLSRAFVTWNLVNHNKFTKASHVFLTCYASKFTNCMHERGRVACQELLSGVSPWLWDSLSVTENFFCNLIGDAPAAAVVAVA